jgi:hypothetical protein
MKNKLLMGLLLCSITASAQELYVFTEPASNMAAKSIGVRLNNFLMKQQAGSSIKYTMVPEIMVGVSKKIMIHGDVFLGNRNGGLATEGGSVYGKYRFFSNDDVQTHFRMAAFGRYSFNNSNIDQEEINLYGRNTGFETGIVATQLLHKVALSSSLSYTKALDNGSNKYPYSSNNSKALNYTVSFGKLMLPKNYTDYKQTNLNLMLELLSQYNLGSGKYYMDLAPSVQLIFNSVARVDVGYRQQVNSTYSRSAPNGLFVRLEYNFFNVY